MNATTAQTATSPVRLRTIACRMIRILRDQDDAGDVVVNADPVANMKAWEESAVNAGDRATVAAIRYLGFTEAARVWGRRGTSGRVSSRDEARLIRRVLGE